MFTNFTRWCWLLVASLLILSITGALQLNTDAATDKLLAKRTSSYIHQLKFLDSYPLEQQQVQAVVRGPLLERANLQQLLLWEESLLADPSVTEVYSFFSDPRVRQRMQDADALKSYLDANEVLRNVFVASDYESGILAIALSDEARLDAPVLEKTLGRLQLLMSSDTSSLLVDFTGLPVLSNALHKVLSRDVWIYIGIAAIASLLVAWLYFGRLPVVMITLAAPLLGTLLLYGLMGWFGIRINLLNQLIGVLVFIVAYTDSLFLCRHALHALNKNKSVKQTIQETYSNIGPACLTTSLTTAVGFGCLIVSESEAIFEVALLGATSVMLTFVVVMLLLPLTISLLSEFQGIAPHEKTLQRILAISSIHKPPHRLRMVVFGIALLAVATLSTQLNSSYTPGENLPKNSDFRQSMVRADQDLDGLLPLQILVEWQDTETFKVGRRMTATLYQIQNSLAASTGTQWSSIANVLAGIPGIGASDKLQSIPSEAVVRFLDVQNATAVMSARMRYSDSGQLRDTVAELNAEIANLNSNRDDVHLSLVGTVPLALQAGSNILRDLWLSLSLAFVSVLVVMSVAFRSWVRASLCLLPSVGAVLSIAAYLVLHGEPVRFVTMMIFSVAMGVVVDHSIHFGFHVTRRVSAGMTLLSGIQDAVNAVGSTALLAQLVLVSGFLTLCMSDTPTVSQLGLLAVIALVVGLFLNLLFLPLLLKLQRESAK